MKNTSSKEYINLSLFTLRLAIGAILIYHGWPKLFGDTAGFLAFFESTVLPAPKIMLSLAGVIEVVGGGLLLIGLGTRLVATIIALQFSVIVLFVNLQKGWEALELDLLLLATSFSLISLGAGKWSIDYFIQSREKNEKTGPGHGAEAITGETK